MTRTPWDLPAVLRSAAETCKHSLYDDEASVLRTLADLVQAYDEKALLGRAEARVQLFRYIEDGPTPPKKGA